MKFFLCVKYLSSEFPSVSKCRKTVIFIYKYKCFDFAEVNPFPFFSALAQFSHGNHSSLIFETIVE